MAINEKGDFEGDWEYILNTKITEVLEDATDPAAFTASITSPNDPLFALTIDHTLLKPDATPAQIDELCEQAILYNFKVRLISRGPYTPFANHHQSVMLC